MKAQKILRRHIHIGRDESQFDDYDFELELGRGDMDRESTIYRRKEQVFHNDFFNMQQDFMA